MKKSFPSDWDNEVEVIEPVTVRSDVYKYKKDSVLDDIIENVGSSPILFLTVAGFGFILGYSVSAFDPDYSSVYLLFSLIFSVVAFIRFYFDWKTGYISNRRGGYDDDDDDDDDYFDLRRRLDNATGVYGRY